MRNILSRAANLIVAPRARLQSDFPWTLTKMGRTYVIASLWFYAGSLLVPGAFFGLLFLAPLINNDLFLWMAQWFDNDGAVSIRFLVVMSAISFVMGFAFELLYLRKVLHREGRTIRGTMGLNFARLRGKTRLYTAWKVVSAVAIAWGIWFAFEQTAAALFGHAPQNTVELFKASQGLDFAILAAMAVLGAPVFEELVFRGFLQNSVSASLKRWKLRRLLGGNKKATDLVADQMPDMDKMVSRLGGSTLAAELLAALASAAIFSVMHLQLHPITLLMLFALGFVHSELYRRTGSLYCSMLLHFVNNGIAVAVLLWSR